MKIDIPASAIVPSQEAVLKKEWGDPGTASRFFPLIQESLGLLSSLVSPQAVFAEVSVREFKEIYRGEGKNDSPAPLQSVCEKASHLALFAITLGSSISQRISKLFAQQDYALGYLLDSVASEAAERTVDWVESRYREWLFSQCPSSHAEMVLRYSPGYCGWHITGQRKLFQRLSPEEIGIVLNESCLMDPLKSVSGVFVAGPAEIHRFDPAYRFCKSCKTKSCRTRTK